MSTSGGGDDLMVSLSRDDSSGIATVTMNRPPVNSFSSKFMVQLASTVREAEHDGGCRAVLLETALPNVFSAGLDLQEVHGLDEQQLRLFWTDFQVLPL